MQKKTLFSLFFRLWAAFAIVTIVLAIQPAMPVYAADITVDTPIDELTTNGQCSLREAIINANSDGPPPQPYPDCAMGNGADTIILQSETIYTLSLVGTTQTGGDLDISDVDGLTIKASGNAHAVIDANDIDRVIQTSIESGPLTLIGITITNGFTASGGRGGGVHHGSSAELRLVNSTISSNIASNSSSCGGGIYNSNEASITITNSTVEGNACTAAGGDGGGLFKGFGGTLTVTGSTFENNSALDHGGAIRLFSAPTATVTNSTFVNNSADNLGGGIHVEDGASLTVNFSTFSGNGAGGGGGALQAENATAAVTASILANSDNGKDCGQTINGVVTLTNTLVEDNDNCSTVSVITGDPGLLALANNGGRTRTMAITTSSPAYNAASTCGSTTTDQRGIARPQDGLCDLGAYELVTDEAAPEVINVTRVNANPTSAASVSFLVTFSEPVTGVDTSAPFSDFVLFKTGSITGAKITAVVDTGDHTSYSVKVATGKYNGTLRLDVVDDDSIRDPNNNPLGGPGAGNGNFTSGEEYTITKKYKSILKSVAAQDGWILESGETTNQGKTFDNAAMALNVGDNAQNKQYRSILSFQTRGLPDNAVITKIALKVKRQYSGGGGNPVDILEGFRVDIRKGFFGPSAALQAVDFQARANRSFGPFNPALKNGWYIFILTPGKNFINLLPSKGGVTQIRLRFNLDDNNDSIANYLKIYSGNVEAGSRPQLVIQYYVP